MKPQKPHVAISKETHLRIREHCRKFRKGIGESVEEAIAMWIYNKENPKPEVPVFREHDYVKGRR